MTIDDWIRTIWIEKQRFEKSMLESKSSFSKIKDFQPLLKKQENFGTGQGDIIENVNLLVDMD